MVVCPYLCWYQHSQGQQIELLKFQKQQQHPVYQKILLPGSSVRDLQLQLWERMQPRARHGQEKIQMGTVHWSCLSISSKEGALSTCSSKIISTSKSNSTNRSGRAQWHLRNWNRNKYYLNRGLLGWHNLSTCYLNRRHLSRNLYMSKGASLYRTGNGVWGRYPGW